MCSDKYNIHTVLFTGKSTRPSTNSSISSYDEDCAFGNRLKREFWFTIPRNKADSIYGFLLQWSPEKYGQRTLGKNINDQLGNVGKSCEIVSFHEFDLLQNKHSDLTGFIETYLREIRPFHSKFVLKQKAFADFHLTADYSPGSCP
ncbi:unnamed protein product, partial [Mesorhabditis belari]|uniref:Uncharacterized protein n=1 Tax=Mesorhabditis belari TaxID=2138241 RepID=A0AAF3F2K9_9BILA